MKKPLTYFKQNCPIRQFTANKVSIGRCWHWLSDGKICPVHGDVSKAVETYITTGELTNEPA